MKVGIYARKSTKDAREGDDPEKSIARQQQLAREFAASKGWTVAASYADDQTSGVHSERLVERSRMMTDAANGQFEIVIVRDSDRLSRDDREVDPVVILDGYNVVVWEYLDGGKRIDVGDATSRLIRNVHRYRGAAHVESTAKNTREQKFAKAALPGERGIADGKVLGYVNAGPAKARRRVVDAEQAKLVTRIFEMSAAGKGYLAIASALNAERIKNPCGQDRRNTTKRTDQWSASGIKAILERELYIGKVVYGRTRNLHRPDGRKKIAGEKVVTVERPELRIVSDELWQAAQQRMASARAQYLRTSGGRLYGKPGAGLESKHLLAGFLQCGVCGGNMFFSKKTGKRGRPVLMYACSNRRSRGEAACSNAYGVPAAELTEAVSAELKKVVLNPTMLGNMLAAELKSRAETPDAAKAQRQELTARAAKLAGEVDRIAEAIAEGAGDSKTLVAKLREREAEHHDALARLEHLNGLEIEAEDFDMIAWLEEMRGVLSNLQAVLESDPTAGRQLLRRLAKTPIVVTPSVGDEEIVFSFKLKAGLADVPVDVSSDATPFAKNVATRTLTGAVSRRALRWCPRGDSNTRHAV